MGTFNHNDSLSTTTNLACPDLDFANDYSPIVETAGECQYAYIKGEVDQPETVRLAIQDVNNVYRNTDVQPGLYSVNKKGKRLLVSTFETYRNTDVAGVTTTDYPIKVGVTFEYPVSAQITEAELMDALKRNVSVILGHSTSSILAKLMRGSLAQ